EPSPLGPTTTAAASTVASSVSISRGGLVGFIGTATMPAPRTARYADTKYQFVPHTIPTRSPGCSSSPASPDRNDATCPRNVPYVVSRPRLINATSASGCGSSTAARFTFVLGRDRYRGQGIRRRRRYFP